VWQARLGRVLRLWGFDLFGLLLIVLWGFILRSSLFKANPIRFEVPFDTPI
jgi:hypothetical protein